MIIINYDTDVPNPVSRVCCIGYFDGIHIGHQALISETLKLAKEKNERSTLITFDPDPWIVIKNISHVPHITTLEDRQKIVEQMGMDEWITIPFTLQLANLKPTEFLESVLQPLYITDLVCGYDFTFGQYGSGTTRDLTECSCFETHIIDQVSDCGEKISSTRICELIEKGNMEEVQRLLGRPYTMKANVIHGQKKGRQIGFPTANLDVNNTYILPQKGVYCAVAIAENLSYPCMVNFGVNPTFNLQEKVSMEAHIIGFSGDLYDSVVTVQLHKKLRDEKKFQTVEELIEQLQKDRDSVSAWFEESAEKN